MAALQGVGMLVERGAVEMAEAMGIVGEMPGHPVEQHAKPSRWQASTSAAKSSGEPNRLVGAYMPVG